MPDKGHKFHMSQLRHQALFFLKALLGLELRIIRINQDNLLATANLFYIAAFFPSL